MAGEEPFFVTAATAKAGAGTKRKRAEAAGIAQVREELAALEAAGDASLGVRF